MGIKKWLFEVALKKGIKRGIQAFVALFGGAKLVEAGITVDQSLLIPAVYGVLEVARNWLKNKLGWKWL